ncbi:MAG: ribosomal RNA small subunit methyltransferase A [Candidatus Omnitrophica bacterium]|nr:ribosomal RNA small subunit methyltransferase A [Candidatus Omnitrophota bacterium]
MDISKLRENWKLHGFRPSKILGQNFLIDKNIRDKILANISLSGDDTVVEIGPGFGAMTVELSKKCASVTAIEKDRTIYDIVSGEIACGKIKMLNEDFLEVDLAALCPAGKKLVVYGNIPYSITTPIIEKVIEARDHVGKVFMVMQDEYARRLTSGPGTKEYGSITCFAQFYAKLKPLFKISKNCFFPVPKVDSCLLSMDLSRGPLVTVKDRELMFRIIRQSFSQRRKQILNTISHSDFLGIDRPVWETILKDTGIGVSLRAENLSIHDFAKIADRVNDK